MSVQAPPQVGVLPPQSPGRLACEARALLGAGMLRAAAMMARCAVETQLRRMLNHADPKASGGSIPVNALTLRQLGVLTDDDVKTLKKVAEYGSKAVHNSSTTEERLRLVVETAVQFIQLHSGRAVAA